MSLAKKTDEQELVDRFVAAWSGRAEIASIEPSESPDFEGMLATGQRFGIEMVTITEPTLAKGHSDIHKRFVPELEEACRKRSVGATFAVHFEEWDAERLADPGHRRKLVDGIADFVRDVRSHPNTMGRRRLEALGIEGLDALTFWEEDVGDFAISVGRVARGRGVNELQACITKKDKKAATYRAKLGRDAGLWLLVVAGTSFADGVEPPMKHLTFETTFDRVFFLDHWPVRHGEPMDRVVELPISPSTRARTELP